MMKKSDGINMYKKTDRGMPKICVLETVSTPSFIKSS